MSRLNPFSFMSLKAVFPIELVPAPDIPNSSFPLSYPAENEQVNSLSKAWVYAAIGNRFPDRYYLVLNNRTLEMHCDFRKNLYIFTSVCRSCFVPPDKPFQSKLHDYSGTGKALPGTLIIWLRGSEFRKFDAIEFKQVGVNLLLVAHNSPHLIILIYFEDNRKTPKSEYPPTLLP